MGVLEQVLAAVDNAKRVAGRNISDMVSSPAAYAERMTDALRNSNRNVVPTAAQGELTNRPMTRDEVNQKFIDASADTLSGGLGVIKPKGGNWLSGKYGPESQLKALRREGRTLDQAIAEAPVPLPPEAQARLAEMQQWPDVETASKNTALNNWIDQKLTKYIKNDMASPNDPIRLMADAWPAEKAAKLAEAEARVQALRQKQTAQAATRGVPEEMLTRTRQDVLRAEEARDVIAENQGLHYTPGYTTEPLRGTVKRREAAGFPAEGMGQTDLARIWENTADSEIGLGSVSDYQRPGVLNQDPWLAKADPEAPVYNLASGQGFQHLTDELRNSLREGRLTPEQLQKMPIDQAVRHVAEINALRAVEANKTRAMDMADMPVHKEYPDTGMSWRQLRQPEGQETWQQQFDARKAELTSGHTKWARDSLYKKIEGELGPSPYQKLERWLKQEGDAMGHCVGGYCDDVASGQSSIYSLRDAKGKPSVTIETSPIDFASGAPLDTPRIVQIKGKNNAAPPAEALPYIQDFIRSGKWSEVQDAGNTGLTPAEIQQILKGTQ